MPIRAPGGVGTNFVVETQYTMSQSTTRITDLPIDYIDTPEGLERLCQALQSAPWTALDTEFIRESTYYPEFCLLQIATPDLIACVDPLRLDDLEPLWRVLYQSRAVKVFHAGFQDLEILHRINGRLPRPVFDTQLAAPLLGYPEQIGYAQLVEQVLGVQLAKGHSRTDWRRRPLQTAQIAYAADDVRYLGPLYVEIHRRLARLGRLDWLEDDFRSLTDPATYTNPPGEAWRRIKGARRLKGRPLAVLKRLAAWREETARAANLPRGWILKDDLLCHIARLQPRSPGELAQLRGLGDKTVKRYGRAICAQVAAAGDETVVPDARHDTAPDPREEALLDLLSAVVRLRALEQRIHPTVLASRKDLERFVRDPAASRLYQGWRRRLIGEELLAFVEGKRGLHVADGQLQLMELAP